MKNGYSWYILLVLTFIIWGTLHPCLKVLSGEVGPFLLNFLRFGLAALVLFPFVMKAKVKVERKDLIAISLLGVVGIFLFGVLDVVGISMSTAMNNAILVNAWPLLVVLLSPIVIRESVARKALFGTLVGFLGIIIVVTNGEGFGVFLQSKFLTGDLLILASAACIATYAMLNEKYVKKYGGLHVTFHAVAAGALLLLLASVLSGEIGGITKLSLDSALLFVWIAVATTALGWVVLFTSVKKIGLVNAASFSLIVPISGVLASYVFLGEQLSVYTVIGAVLTLVGVYIVQIKEEHGIHLPRHH